MNEREDEAPFPREPWRRLLEDSADGPPETTDARIRAAARRDLAPRGQRWWLPASLAASFVLAVMIVHSEFGTIRRAPMTQSDRAGGPAMDARIIDRSEGPEARAPGASPSTPDRRKAPARESAQAEDYGYLEPETGSDLAGIGPRVGGPEHDLKAASELPEEIQSDLPAPPVSTESAPSVERKLREIVVTGSRQRTGNLESTTPVTGVTAGFVRDDAAQAGAALARPRTPEAWYAAIEKLRAEGRTEEAERELERLKEAYPGWLEKHLAKQAPR
jgi:hypothetical protein